MEFLAKVVEYAQPIMELIGWLAVVATVVVRMPFLKANPAKVDGVVVWVQKVLSWLPTLGINPRTQAIEAALAEFKK